MPTELTKMQAYLLGLNSPTFSAYYNGKMSYALHGKEWKEYVNKAFPDLAKQQTSENVFKTVIDLYAENLVPVPEELRGFSNVLVPLLSRGASPVVVDSAGSPHFPEHYEMISDGKFTVAAIFTRSLAEGLDFVTFVDSSGASSVWAKDIPTDFSPATREGYQHRVDEQGSTLFRFALDDKGFGGSLAALQDRVNHSILDKMIVEEMYARPFWYLLNTELPPKNPYLPQQPAEQKAMKEEPTEGASGRVFVTSSEGPFGQLTPPTLADMISNHDSILDAIPLSTGIPAHYFKPGQGTPPTGVALKVLSRRFNNKVARLREDIEPTLEELATLLGVERTGEDKDATGEERKTFEFWPESDDLLQDALDAHGISLSQMGYPLEYIAEVVTPGVDLDDYMDDGFAQAQRALTPTPDQIAAYAANPGQRAGQPAINPVPTPPAPPQV